MRSDARKRGDGLPVVIGSRAELDAMLARAYDRGWNDSADYVSADYDGPEDPPNPYDGS